VSCSCFRAASWVWRLDIFLSPSASSPLPALSTSSTRPSSRADRRLRFAELSPQDVHVYESAPPSPRRKPLALPPPLDDSSAVSLGQWKGTLKPQAAPSEDTIKSDPEEGTAEYIRRRYFPDAPANDPNLAWMEQSPAPPESDTSSYLRFDLTGKPVPPFLSSELPTHLGLHHHAEGQHAGYTLDDVFMLSRSSVPAQRATMLGVLARIAQRISRSKHGEVDGMDEFLGKEEELRKRIVAAGVEAMSERGSVGARAVEVIWQCVVGWDDELLGVEGVELEVADDAAISSLPLEFILPQIAVSFAQGDLPVDTMSQLLDILHRLALHSNGIATSITTTPKLVPNVVQAFLLTPIPATDSSPLPNPSALQFLIVLAKSSRSNATSLQDLADALLRFITMLPPTSPYPSQLSIALLMFTLRFYTTLASFGLYSNIASTAMMPLTQLTQYILSDVCTSRRLMVAWTELLENWMVCAVDPHRTTPTHDILWSQIVGWGWHAEVRELSRRLGADKEEWDAWAGVWRVQAAWLEGSRVNGVRAGSSERAECIEFLKGGFEGGKEREVVIGVINAIRDQLSCLGTTSDHVRLRAMAGYANTLAAAIRLWLSCLPPLSEGTLASPPFTLPFSQISELCAKITVHSFWSFLNLDPRTYGYCRPFSELLSCYLWLSRRLPGISQELWIAQSLAILCKVLPGDEEFALEVMEDLTDLLTSDWMASRGIQVPPVVRERGMSVIKPFLSHTLRPQEDVYINPLHPTPRSIMLATTQRLPSYSAIRAFGLPTSRDWTLSPLDHLLRSGSSTAFRSLPSSWDASEAEIARASLLLTKIAREALNYFSLSDFVLTREEAIFGCMKVFMLEHGQPQNDSAEEVFRDRTVEQFMHDLLQPYTVAASPTPPAMPVVPAATIGDLEEVATRFLGKTPFYQYYTDFLALYDAISFSHPLFARLLLPPTSMRYAVDYRKHLWNDYAHLLKTIRTPVDQVLCQDIGEYLWPIESDAQMIGHYLRSLLKDGLQGFIHLVALHHIASNIWQDIHQDAGWNEERASKLLAAVVDQGSANVVKQVVRYQQRMAGGCLLQPVCFDPVGEEVKVLRLRCLDRWGGQALVKKLDGLFY
jgi:RNA polymerase II-associated protein 1